MSYVKDSNQTFFSFYEDAKQDLLYFEKKAKSQGYKKIAGLYVEGQNALAGPIVSAICILPPSPPFLSVLPTRKTFHQIISCQHLYYAIDILEPEQIQKQGIFSSIGQSMLTTFSELSHKPDFLLIDGAHHPLFPVPCQSILQGDILSLSISYAAVLAKITRNAILEGYQEAWPDYGFAQNKGFSTPDHIKKIKLLGLSPVHIQYR